MGESENYYQLNLLKCTSKSKSKFIKNFKNLDYSCSQKLYFEILNGIIKATLSDDIDGLKSLNWFLNYISKEKDDITLHNYYNDSIHLFEGIFNIVVLTSKHNKMKSLEYIFSDECKLLFNLSTKISKNSINPNDEDEDRHNAFYYAIRSSNTKLLELLIKKWPNDYFHQNCQELDEILSSAYKELKIKNIELSDEMQIFVENELINFRFFSEDTKLKPLNSAITIKGRIQLVTENVEILKTTYPSTEVDEKFIFLAKFIARNIFILKRQLKCTYNKLPWEEIEFCIIAFVSSRITDQEINLIYNSVLNKAKVITYLEHFVNCLQKEFTKVERLETRKLSELPKMKREDVIAVIIRSSPLFENLYNDYKLIRDIHSLDSIKKYIDLSLSVDYNYEEGQLIITRTLQVVGEYLKNTLESPKLSNATCEHLLSLLPKKTRHILIDLRNSLSHVHSLAKRLEIEANADAEFLQNVQNDVKKISIAITQIIFKNKIRVIKMLLSRIVKSENFVEMKEIYETFKEINIDIKAFGDSNIHLVNEIEEIEELIEQFSSIIGDKTSYEEELLKKVHKVIDLEKHKNVNIKSNYLAGVLYVYNFVQQIRKFKIDINGVRSIKFGANKALEYISTKIEPQNLKEIAYASRSLFNSVQSRVDNESQEELLKLIHKIFVLVEFEVGNVKWIEELRNKLSSNNKYVNIPSNIVMNEQKKNSTEENQKEQLALKISTLKNNLSKNALITQLIEKFPVYKNDKKLQAVIEMLILDIMSILSGSKNYLTDNVQFLDEDYPLLVGKNLRNHLAHGNALFDILQSDCSATVIANARKITTEDIIKNRKKIGKLVNTDPIKLNTRYDQELSMITVQKSMFDALVKGSYEDLQKSIRDGADINARNLNLWTALHFACMGSNLQIVKFLIDQNLNVNSEDIKGLVPLHVAAAYGQENVVEFFVKQKGVAIDVVDNSMRTSLHIAAENGHKNVINALLNNNALPDLKDLLGCSPLHYAITHNHKDATKVLLEAQNVDADVMLGGFTPLHAAAEVGHLELVELLLKKKATVNAKTDKQATPLHTAALNGHLTTLKALILKGADVNIQTIDGGTALHYAAENSHQEIIEVLLENGANASSVDGFKYIPLHFAAYKEHLKIVKALARENVNNVTIDGMTPLYLAAAEGHCDIAKFLMSKNASLTIKDMNGYTALHASVLNGHKNVVKLLMEKGAKVNITDKNGQTPLHLSSINNNCEMVEILIAQGADIDCKDNNGSTALHLSSQNGQKDVVKILIANRASVKIQNKFGLTPLFSAIASASVEIMELLIAAGANISLTNSFGFKALHYSALLGNKEIVESLLKRNANVNDQNICGSTPLHLAVQSNHREITNILIENGAKVDVEDHSGNTSLFYAVKNNCKEIVDYLIKGRADVNVSNGRSLQLAILSGYTDIATTLLQNEKCNINITAEPGGISLLHLAAIRGHQNIVHTLIRKGAEIDATDISNMTALHCAASEGHNTVAKVLLENKAKLNIRSTEGSTPLHIAAVGGHVNVVKTLLDNGANPNIADFKNRTSIEQAVAHGKLQVVKILLQHKSVKINDKGNDNLTLLHIAAQMGYLEIIKCLIENGADIDAKNILGSKSIHFAARDGHKDVLQFFLDGKAKADHKGAFGQTLLHYAATGGQAEITKYLIDEKMDVNSSTDSDTKPIHIAASFGFEDIVTILIQHGAYFNAISRVYGSALDQAEKNNNKKIIKLLTSVEKLFTAVKHNNISEVEKYIKEETIVDAKSSDEVTPLHYASWKGYESIVTILLKHKANPNVIGKSGCTPLHYAVKFNHLGVVKTLLSYRAGYDIACNNKKTPLDFATDNDIKSLLKLIHESFKNVQNGNSEVIYQLKKVKDKDTLKLVMNSRNRENKTLAVVGIHSDFPNMKQLKKIMHDDMSTEIKKADYLCIQEKYNEALVIFQKVFENKKETLGHDNPDTLEIQHSIAMMQYKQHNYHEAIKVLEDVYRIQKEVLGMNNAETLKTRAFIALVLHRQGMNEEALVMYEEVLPKQKEILGSKHSDVLNTQTHMALTLNMLGKHEEALNVNYEILRIHKKSLGLHHPLTLVTQNNIALVLNCQGKFDEASKMYKKVYEARKIVLGPNHSDTLRTFHNMVGASSQLKGNSETTKAFEEVLDLQKNALGTGHLDTLNTQYNMANLLLSEGKFITALKLYEECLDKQKTIFGPNHPQVMDIKKRIEVINLGLSMTGGQGESSYQQNDGNESAGGFKSIAQEVITKGNIDYIDENGLTMLHYAVSERQNFIVENLLASGANVMLISNKGNTGLHIAASKGFIDIVDILLTHVKNNNNSKLNDFLNVKTTNGGTAALHVAANLEIAISLLKFGAIYNIKNKNGDAPINLSKQQDIKSLLKLVNDLFTDLNDGKKEIIKKLEKLKPDELLAVTNAHNSQGETLLQLAVKYQDIAREISKLLKLKSTIS